MPAAAPVAVRREELAQRRAAPRRESMVASRIGQSPETPVAQSSGCEPRFRRSSACGARSAGLAVEEMAGQLLEDRGVAGREAELAQLDLARGPGEVERALRGVRIVVAVGQLEGALPAWWRRAW